MTNNYSLDDLRNDLDQDYQPLVIDAAGQEIVLQHLLRLSREDRAKVTAAIRLINELNLDGEDENASIDAETFDKFHGAVFDVLYYAAGEDGETLTSALRDDLMLATKLARLWQEVTQPGEASPSPT